MADLPLPHVADEPTLDLAAWHPVVSGLNVMRGALIFAMYCFVFGTILLVAAFSFLIMHQVRWLSFLALGAAGLSILIMIAALLLGMGLCCLAPSDGGASRYAQAAFVLALTTLTLFVGWLAIEFVILQQVSQDWFNHIMRLYDFGYIFVIVLVMNAWLAVTCWHRFIQAAATWLQRCDLADSARAFVIWFSVWTGCAFLAIWLALHGDSWQMIPLLALAPITVVGAPSLVVWSVSLLLDLRKDLVTRLQPAPAPAPSP